MLTKNKNSYENTALRIANVVTEKQKQYGNSINDTEDFLKLLYPDRISTDQYKDMGILIRIFDKLKRIANGNQGDENAWDDLLGYALLKSNETKNIKGKK